MFQPQRRRERKGKWIFLSGDYRGIGFTFHRAGRRKAKKTKPSPPETDFYGKLLYVSEILSAYICVKWHIELYIVYNDI